MVRDAETDIKLRIKNGRLILIAPIQRDDITSYIVRKLRKAAKFTQQETADILAVSKSTVSKVENLEQDLHFNEFKRWITHLYGAEKIMPGPFGWTGKALVRR